MRDSPAPARAEWQTAEYVRAEEGAKEAAAASVKAVGPTMGGLASPRTALWDLSRVVNLTMALTLVLAVAYRYGGWAVDVVVQGPLSKDPWQSRGYLVNLGLGWDSHEGCAAGDAAKGEGATCCAKAWSMLREGDVLVKGGGAVVKGCPQVGWAVPAVSMPQWEALVERTLGTTQYVEWGSGGTTESVAPLAAHALSIEHFAPACRCVQSRPFLEAERKAKCLNFVCVDTQLDLDKFASPSLRNTPDEKRAGWERYVDAIDGNLQTDAVDVVVVNGVARIGCALKSLAYAHANTTVLVHDWPRTYEEHLLAYFDVEDVITPSWSIDRGLAVLRPKPEYLGDTQLYKKFVGSWG